MKNNNISFYLFLLIFIFMSKNCYSIDAKQINWTLPVSEIKKQVRIKEDEIKQRPFKFLSHSFNKKYPPYKSIYNSKNKFFSANFHSDEVKYVKSDKCKPLNFFLAVRGKSPKIYPKYMNKKTHLLLLEKDKYIDLTQRELTSKDIINHWSGSIFIPIYFWSSYSGNTGLLNSKNFGSYFKSKVFFNWKHRCVKNKNVFILKNPNWKKTSHSKLIFNFKTMIVNEDLYSISDPKKIYQTHKYYIIRYIEGYDFNKTPDHKVQKKMLSMADIPNNFVKIQINDNENGDLKKWRRRSTVLADFQFGELKIYHEHGMCDVKGQSTLSGPTYYNAGKNNCGYHIIEDKKLSKNKLVAILHGGNAGFYEFDFKNNKGTYIYPDRGRRGKVYKFPFKIIYN
tara:strand:+ start:1422 stop:2606 length:1185 start_codon:yes stop_codon:yes gene_type:complete